MRSKFEKEIAEQLTDAGIEWEYEEEVFLYSRKISKGYCPACDSDVVYQSRLYTPDFTFPSNDNILLEVKGRFTGKDRMKMRSFKAEWPDLDIRLVFYRNDKLKLKGAETHLAWAEKYGFPACVKVVPKNWLKEIQNER